MNVNSSIDKKELNKFNEVSSEWWNEEGPFKILHKINHLRIEYILEKINIHFSKKKQTSDISILDAGCGGGLVASELYKRIDYYTPNITAIDPLYKNIQIARQYIKNKSIEINYLNTTVEELVNTKVQFDVILCLEVIEHVNQIEFFIKNLSNMLKPNGFIIISTINRTFKAYLFAILIAENILKWIKQGTHEYKKFLKPSEINKLFSNEDIKIKELKGLNYNILKDSWELTNDISINYLAYLIKI